MHESVGQIWHLKNFYCPNSLALMGTTISQSFVKIGSKTASFVPVQDTVMLGLSTRSSLLAGHSIL